jgi:hypothetical protein
MMLSASPARWAIYPALLPRLLARVKLLEAGSPQSDDPLPSS